MEVSDQLHALANLSLREEPLVPSEREAGWVPEPVWTRWRREKNPRLCLGSNFGRPACSLVTLLTDCTLYISNLVTDHDRHWHGCLEFQKPRFDSIQAQLAILPHFVFCLLQVHFWTQSPNIYCTDNVVHFCTQSPNTYCTDNVEFSVLYRYNNNRHFHYLRNVTLQITWKLFALLTSEHLQRFVRQHTLHICQRNGRIYEGWNNERNGYRVRRKKKAQ
jgi:hypothetical protein